MADSQKDDEAQWRAKLSPEEYRICREKGTERPFTGEYCHEMADGTYVCKCCGHPLFDAASKYDAGCGWPSFYQGLSEGDIAEHPDVSHGMIRTEITCAHCGCHLGHVFEDGPAPTGLRYCVNSASLALKKKV